MILDNIRKMPIGIQDFADLRSNNYVYVDKTMYLHRLVTMGKPYFLGRPRRFGKSLFISTLKYYFQGRKDLFDGLYISEVEKEWVEYPVIYFDFSQSECKTQTEVQFQLSKILSYYEHKYGIEQTTDSLNYRFERILNYLHHKTGKRVVF
jgi:hypothetical protein